MVTLFFPYRALAAHLGVEDEIVQEVESTSIRKIVFFFRYFIWISACVWCIYFTYVYTHGLMPCVFFFCTRDTHACDTLVTHLYCLTCGWFVLYQSSLSLSCYNILLYVVRTLIARHTHLCEMYSKNLLIQLYLISASFEGFPNKHYIHNVHVLPWYICHHRYNCGHLYMYIYAYSLK